MGTKPNWKEHEIKYLIENWGSKPIKSIAKELGRSESAITQKAAKLKLGAFLDSGDYITVNQLFNALGLDNGLSYTVNVWIKDLGLPITRKKVRNNTFKVIKIDKFWIWAEKNQARIDLSILPKNLLGIEPEWVEEKRRQDSIRRRTISKSAKSIKWTDYEDNLLLSLLKSYKYTTDEISQRLDRSEGAVIRRISELKIKYRPLRNDPHSYWTNEEYETLQSMICGGGNYVSIHSAIPRHSEKAIRGLVYRLWNTEKLDIVRNKIRGGLHLINVLVNDWRNIYAKV